VVHHDPAQVFDGTDSAPSNVPRSVPSASKMDLGGVFRLG
jgi:hypothetical protein